jgi:hypothetical protein
MPSNRRTQCANKMPWPAGNHRSLERFLDEAERTGALDTIAEHPAAATALAQPPYSLDAASVGTVLRDADSREQAAAYVNGWHHWLQAVGDDYPDTAASVEGFAAFTSEITAEHWDAQGETSFDDFFISLVDAAVAAKKDGVPIKEALDTSTGATSE